MSTPDKLHYLRIPNSVGGRAEMTRMVYVLAGRPYLDVLHPLDQAREAVAGKNPYKQYPFVETASGQVLYQTMAIMHHAAHGTPTWPADPEKLTQALQVAMGGYDLYQWFGSFAADDLPAKKKFEETRAPQLFGALAEIYAKTPFATGEAPGFADCIAHQAIVWCVRRNEVSRGIFEASPALVAFRTRFEAVPVIKAFMARQAKAREADNAI
jgi:glutathione S-transferase